LPRYLKNRQTDLETLRGAFQAGNLEQIRSIGHTLKGYGSSFGLDAIDVFSHIENYFC
jgi:HPt (histidine-containing phosphotransfer) domain-containing protein